MFRSVKQCGKSFTRKVSVIWWIPLLLISCQFLSKEEAEESNDKVLAEVHGKELLMSEVETMLPPGLSAQDSTARIRAHVERWVKETLLMHEAEKNLNPDLNIDKLVRDYRSSLILHNYEQQLIETMVDSVVEEQELEAYYEKNKDQYPLEDKIVQVLMLSYPLDSDRADKLEKWWSTVEDTTMQERLILECGAPELTCLLDPNAWFEATAVTKLFPENQLEEDQLQAGRSVKLTVEGRRFLLEVLDSKSPNETSPFQYVRPQLERVILHQRQMNILETQASELYIQESNRGNVKIY